MTFRMIVQLWNTNTSAFVSCDADLAENYMYISMKFGTGVHVFCWEVGVFNRSSFQSVSYNEINNFTFPFMYLSKLSISHALFKHSRYPCRDILDMCFRRIKFRHEPLAWQIIVIPHTKKSMLAIECILK